MQGRDSFRLCSEDSFLINLLTILSAQPTQLLIWCAFVCANMGNFDSRTSRPTSRGWPGSPRIADLSFCLNSCRSVVLGFCILSSARVIVALRLSPPELFQDGPGRRQTRAMVETQTGSRSRLWLLVSRL